mmetsp:Transcript_4831/g.15441  ORF Transcript_4831/g.15441 Transcript_4831/m.15441 type:complete len:758 (-) Transcript_4831:450-2723(-)
MPFVRVASGPAPARFAAPARRRARRLPPKLLRRLRPVRRPAGEAAADGAALAVHERRGASLPRRPRPSRPPPPLRRHPPGPAPLAPGPASGRLLGRSRSGLARRRQPRNQRLGRGVGGARLVCGRREARLRRGLPSRGAEPLCVSRPAPGRPPPSCGSRERRNRAVELGAAATPGGDARLQRNLHPRAAGARARPLCAPLRQPHPWRWPHLRLGATTARHRLDAARAVRLCVALHRHHDHDPLRLRRRRLRLPARRRARVRRQAAAAGGGRVGDGLLARLLVLGLAHLPAGGRLHHGRLPRGAEGGVHGLARGDPRDDSDPPPLRLGGAASRLVRLLPLPLAVARADRHDHLPPPLWLWLARRRLHPRERGRRRLRHERAPPPAVQALPRLLARQGAPRPRHPRPALHLWRCRAQLPLRLGDPRPADGLALRRGRRVCRARPPPRGARRGAAVARSVPPVAARSARRRRRLCGGGRGRDGAAREAARGGGRLRGGPRHRRAPRLARHPLRARPPRGGGAARGAPLAQSVRQPLRRRQGCGRRPLPARGARRVLWLPRHQRRGQVDHLCDADGRHRAHLGRRAPPRTLLAPRAAADPTPARLLPAARRAAGAADGARDAAPVRAHQEGAARRDRGHGGVAPPRPRPRKVRRQARRRALRRQQAQALRRHRARGRAVPRAARRAVVRDGRRLEALPLGGHQAAHRGRVHCAHLALDGGVRGAVRPHRSHGRGAAALRRLPAGAQVAVRAGVQARPPAAA